MDRARGRLHVPILAFLIHRSILVFFSAGTLAVDPHLDTPQPMAGVVLVRGLARWDSGWFALIAANGYEHAFETNFFPLFPLLGHWTAQASGLDALTALVLVANLAGLMATIAVYRVFCDLSAPRTALMGLLFWMAWPFSFFHAAAYPETLMIAGSALAIGCAIRGRHATAGVWLGCGMLARHLTALTWLSMLAAGVQKFGGSPRRLARSPVAAGALAAGALVSLYFCYLWFRFGDPMIWAKSRSAWGDRAWWGVWTLITTPAAREPFYFVYVFSAIIPAVGGLMLLRNPRLRVLAPFCLALMAVSLFTGLAGLGRYTASCWPAFLPLAAWLDRRPRWWRPVIAFFAIGQLVLLYFFSHGYPIT